MRATVGVVDELPGGIRRVTLPLPAKPGHVHAYAIPVDEGIMLVDTGLGLPDAVERWEVELAQLPAPVVTIFLTHFHPDHLGAARDVQELTGARVVQGRLDAEQAVRVWGSDAWVSVLDGWFQRNGVPWSATEELLLRGEMVKPLVHIATDPILVDPGDDLHGWQLVAAPGHADGQLMLLRDGVLIAADHLLDTISPAVGLWPASRPDPLGDYLGALEQTIALAPEVAYAGHGATIPDPVGRAREILAHHEVRLRATAAALGLAPRTAYDISCALFGDDLGPGARRFAVAETLSHLERLVREGVAVRHEPGAGDVAVVSYTAPD